MVDIAHIGPGLVVDAHRVQGHQDRVHQTTQARNEYVHDEHCALRKQQKHAQDADDHVEFSHATGCQWLFKQQMGSRVEHKYTYPWLQISGTCAGRQFA